MLTVLAAGCGGLYLRADAGEGENSVVDGGVGIDDIDAGADDSGDGPPDDAGATADITAEAANDRPDVRSDGTPDGTRDTRADGGTDGRDAAAAPVAVCGDGLVQSGELCEGSGPLCRGCGGTPTYSCLEADVGRESVCSTLSGTSSATCWALLNCMARGFFSCKVCGENSPSCYCSDETCSAGANGPCAGQYAAVAGSSAIAEILRQRADSTSVLNRLDQEASRYACAQACADVDVANGYEGRLVINEVDYVQLGTDTEEFVEIVNGTAASVNLAGYELQFFRNRPAQGSEKYLVIPLSGTLAANEYLVVTSPLVTLANGVKRIYFALPQTNIDNNFYDVVLIKPGSPDVPTDSTRPGVGNPPLDDPNGTICRQNDGTATPNNDNWTFCQLRTPGGPNRH